MTIPPQHSDEWLDRILVKLENEVARDAALRAVHHQSGKSPKQSHYEAKQAILAELKEREVGGFMELPACTGEFQVIAFMNSKKVWCSLITSADYLPAELRLAEPLPDKEQPEGRK